MDDVAPAGEDGSRRVTQDAFLGGRLTILQPRTGPRAGIDAVFLAAAAPVRPGARARVLEAGFGHGVAGLALAARVEDAHVTGVELQPALAGLARENARLNGLGARVTVIEADVTAPPSRLAAAGLTPESFDHVMANPPFHLEGRSRSPADPVRARAHIGPACALDAWIKFLTAMARPRATLTVIHRADALGEILRSLERRFGAVTVFPLFPRPEAPASRVIVQGVKGSRAAMAVAPGLVLHRDDGGFTDAAERILRSGEALTLTR